MSLKIKTDTEWQERKMTITINPNIENNFQLQKNEQQFVFAKIKKNEFELAFFAPKTVCKTKIVHYKQLIYNALFVE